MCYIAYALLGPKLQTKSKRELGGWSKGMAMCVCERDREKVGDGRGESGSGKE